MNIMTVDVEDWYQTTVMERLFPRKRWDSVPYRCRGSIKLLLSLFKRYRVRATFFILGWIAEKDPGLVEEIKKEGHEIASHGYFHKLVYKMEKREFAHDLKRSLGILKRITGEEAKGYIAPSFSVKKECRWFFDVLADNGIEYDCSIFPIGFHPTYGWKDAPMSPFILKINQKKIFEIPGTVVDFLGLRIPFAGGAYFRVLPYSIIKGLTKIKEKRGENVIYYLHPWEFDREIPRVRLSLANRMRTYFNIPSTLPKLEALLKRFRFISVEDYIKAKGDRLPMYSLTDKGDFVKIK